MAARSIRFPFLLRKVGTQPQTLALLNQDQRLNDFISKLSSPFHAHSVVSVRSKVMLTQNNNTVHQHGTGRSIPSVQTHQNWAKMMSTKSEAPVLKPIRVRSSKAKRWKQVRVEASNSDVWLGGKDKRMRLDMIMERTENIGHQSDQIEATINKLGSLHTAFDLQNEQERDLAALNRKIRFKTIERKYFRKARSPNLLTWAAKEQMRYLHHKEELSVEELANLYPVSAEIVLKIVKSRVRLHRDEDKQRHDRDVRNNWLKIKTDLDLDKDVSESILKGLRNENNELVVQNAVGLGTSPLPQPVGPARPKGPFSMIVKDCLDEKLKEFKQSQKAEWEFREKFIKELEHISNIMAEESNKSALATEEETQEEHPFRHNSQERSSGRDVQQMSFDYNQKKKRVGSTQIVDASLTKVSERMGPATIQHGDCVYDKKGVFLYRIP